MRIKTLITAGLGLTALALVPTRTTQAEAEFVASFGTAAPDGTPWSDLLVKLKTEVATKTNGRVGLKLFTGSVLGGEVEMIRDVRRNSRLQGGGFSTGALAEGANIPLLQITELPYLFANTNQVDCVLDNVLMDPMRAQLEAKGFHLSFWSENGWRNFGTKSVAARSPDQLAGVKMRSQESDVHTMMYSALGANAVTLPISEVLTGLQTGIVDGFDNSPLFTQAAGLHEPIDYYILSRHIYQPAAIVWSKTFWDALPPDIQAGITEVSAPLAAEGRISVRAMNESLLSNFPALGVEVIDLTDAERQAFAAKTKSVHLQYAQTVSGGPELLKTVNTALKGQCAL
ncbi:MAG: TRAP-type C4-dicarboxylate transport system substrate-binding protein [Myxococcota bacterium]|jgi:TRAP-type C4-dicarboxylate transport system substrate-binding protein